MDICVIFGDSELNSGRIIRYFAGCIRFLRTLAQYLITFCSRQESPNDVISSVAVEWVGLDVLIKFGDFRSNCS